MSWFRRVVYQWELVQQKLDPLRIKVSREIPAFGRVSWWYGRAFLVLERDAAVYYPIPFNWVVRALRELWLRVKFPPWGRMDSLLKSISTDAYRRGVQDGRAWALRNIEESMSTILASWERDLISKGQTPLIVGVQGGKQGDAKPGSGSAAQGPDGT